MLDVVSQVKLRINIDAPVLRILKPDLPDRVNGTTGLVVIQNWQGSKSCAAPMEASVDSCRPSIFPTTAPTPNATSWQTVLSFPVVRSWASRSFDE